MYRWQTLTLARAEDVLSRDRTPRTTTEDTRTLHQVRDVLYRIKLKHFPEPVVSCEPANFMSTRASRSLSLTWGVDGRDLIIEFAGGEAGYTLRHPDDLMEGGDLDLANCAGEIGEITHWLLFGLRPPKETPEHPAGLSSDDYINALFRKQNSSTGKL